METDCHDAISSVECFFYTIAMMDVDVNVEHARMIPSRLWRRLSGFSPKRVVTGLTEVTPKCRARCLQDHLSRRVVERKKSYGIPLT